MKYGTVKEIEQTTKNYFQAHELECPCCNELILYILYINPSPGKAEGGSHNHTIFTVRLPIYILYPCQLKNFMKK